MEGIRLLHENGLLYVFAFIFGSAVGSFLNVVIHRWPMGLSIVRPGSHCPSCNTPIPWYWNLPVISWLLLRGRCRWCGAGISVRYLLVEAATGAWAVLMLWNFGITLSALMYFIFGAALLAGSVIDIYHMMLPDIITVGLIPLGLLISVLPGAWVSGWPVSGWEAVIGAVLGSGLFLLVLVIFKLASGREGMGLGDVKLMGSIGAFLGYPALPVAILIASPAGIIAWVAMRYLKKVDRNYPVPFGPFLSLGAVVVIMAREWLTRNWFIISWL